MFKVISEFVDSLSGQRKHPGDLVEADESRAEMLRKIGVIGPEAQKPEPVLQPEEGSPLDVTDEPYIRKDDDPGEIEPEPVNPEPVEATPDIEHLGGGWYRLPNGAKVHGKDNAMDALTELQKQ